MRLIDADALAYEILLEYGADGGTKDVNTIYGMVINAPTIEAEPVKHGEWIVYEMHTTQYGEVGFECSVCGVPYRLEHRLGADVGWHYCPTCGAKNR